ncbi:MAG: hypothetical protein Q8Q09_13930 [Deltaproteobacteria bacterium]|nr:hypothetical protein [Deltaproteobacteria bacterium]
MKNTHILLIALATVSSVSACRKRRPEANANAAQAQPSGTPSATPETPAVPTTPGVTGANSNAASSVRSTPPAPATGCPALIANAQLGAGTVHNRDITLNETWSLEGSPHRLPDGALIGDNVTLTLAPCTVVLVGHDQPMVVSSGGALVSVGDAEHPIRIGSDKIDPQPGDWDGLTFEEQSRSTSRLAFTTLEHGGRETGERPACLHNDRARLSVQHVTLRACRAYGVSVENAGSFSDDSVDLQVHEQVLGGASHGAAVVFYQADAVRTLPTGSYDRNEKSEILISGIGPIVTASGTWRNPGVRYVIAPDIDLRVQGAGAPVLTIAPGNTLAFGVGSNLTAGWDTEGGVVVDGSNEAGRITLTAASSDPSAGDWKGVFLGERVMRSRTKFNFVTIAYAGRDDSTSAPCPWNDNEDDGALYLSTPLPAQAISHVTFTNLPENTAAIVRAWYTGTLVSYTAPELGNDFAQAGTTCHQSPGRNGSTCPEPARCD